MNTGNKRWWGLGIAAFFVTLASIISEATGDSMSNVLAPLILYYVIQIEIR